MKYSFLCYAKIKVFRCATTVYIIRSTLDLYIEGFVLLLASPFPTERLLDLTDLYSSSILFFLKKVVKAITQTSFGFGTSSLNTMFFSIDFDPKTLLGCLCYSQSPSLVGTSFSDTVWFIGTFHP